MKNKRMEHFRLRSIRSAQKYQGKYKNGIINHHWFAEFSPESLSWWTDITFRLGKRDIHVSWCHPRYEYQNLVEELARKSVHHLYVSKADSDDMFEGAIPKYKKVGRSRKKITSWRTKERSPDHKIWWNALVAAEAKFAKEGRYSIKPSIKTEWLSWCRYVTICAPFEVRSHEEAVRMADLVRSFLLGKTSLENEFPGYAYTFSDWEKEGLADKTLGAHPMGVAL